MALIIILSVMNGFHKEVRDAMLSAIPHVELHSPDGDALPAGFGVAFLPNRATKDAHALPLPLHLVFCPSQPALLPAGTPLALRAMAREVRAEKGNPCRCRSRPTTTSRAAKN